MRKIESKVRTNDPAFQQNRQRTEALVAELRERLAAARAVGAPEARRRHKERGKLLARERVETLIDPGTAFLELSALAAYDLYGGGAPGAGMITGIGSIEGRQAMIVANDATVKGGTYFPMTVKKHLRAQEIALENHLPCVYLVDSGGAFLPLQAEIFPDRDHFGRIFYNQARLSAMCIPQIAVVMGSCTAGGAYVPAMCDENVIVRGIGTIFLGGPPLVKAATGEEVTAEELAAEMCIHAFPVSPIILRPTITTQSTSPGASSRASAAAQRPRSDPRHRRIPPTTRRSYTASFRPTRVRRWTFARSLPASSTVAACRSSKRSTARLWSRPSRAFMDTRSGSSPTTACSSPSRHSRQRTSSRACCQRRIPLLFLQNITGFIVGRRYEHGGIARDGAKMVHAVATAAVPKITVLIGASNGAGNYGMCGRAYGPRFLFMWPNGRISVMGGEQAANTLLTVKLQQLESRGESMSEQEQNEFVAPIREKYEEEGSPYYSTARLWDDGIVDPLDTRDAVGLSLAAAANAPIPETRVGVYRM